MRTVLVTLDTPRQRADLELPVEAPVGELLPLLIEAFQLAATATPPAEAANLWMLRAPNGAPLHPARSLADGGIVDGMRLVLQDVTSYQMERQREAAALPQQLPAGPTTGGIGIRWNRDGLLP